MRDYAKVSPRFWLGSTGRQLRKDGADAQVVALYLLTAPTSNMIGLYCLSIATLANDTGMPMRRANHALHRLGGIGFADYDIQAEVVWVHEMARFQIAERLKPGDKQCKGVQREYAQLPENQFLAPFFEKYSEPFNLTVRRGLDRSTGSTSEGPPKALRSQEQEQDQEKEHAHAQNRPAVETATAMQHRNGSDVLQRQQIPFGEIVNLFNEHMANLPQARMLNDKRRRLIRGAWESDSRCQSLKFWKAYFEECSEDDFLNGTGPYKPLHWKPDFDFLMRPEQIARTYEKAMAETRTTH